MALQDVRDVAAQLRGEETYKMIKLRKEAELAQAKLSARERAHLKDQQALRRAASREKKVTSQLEEASGLGCLSPRSYPELVTAGHMQLFTASHS